MAVGLLAAAPAPPRRPAPTPVPAREQGPALGDDALPTPRALPTGPPREEPAPMPREQLVPPVVIMPSGTPREEVAPMPREQTPMPPRLAIPSALRAAPPPDIQALHREIEGLRMEREALLSEQTDLLSAKALRSAHGDDSARLRRRVAEVLVRAAQTYRPKPEPPSATTEHRKPAGSDLPMSPGSMPSHRAGEDVPSPRPTKTDPSRSSADGSHAAKSPRAGERDNTGDKTVTTAPVDSRTLAETLFLAGDHAAALKIYRQLEKEEQRGDERTVLQYMAACCLRKLGKLDEASLLYREVANSGGDDVLVENAQWYLREMKERRGLEGQLDELRQRRKSLSPRKP